MPPWYRTVHKKSLLLPVDALLLGGELGPTPGHQKTLEIHPAQLTSGQPRQTCNKTKAYVRLRPFICLALPRWLPEAPA